MVYVHSAKVFQRNIPTTVADQKKKTKAIENETSSKLKRPYITTISDDDYRINGKVDRKVKKGHTHYHESEGETELMNRYEDTLNSKCAMST